MTTEVRSRSRKTGAETGEGRPRAADVFVIFGITGDLAKVMTFHSLYRLERRGLLSCPIVGVAVDDWSAEDLRDHAHAAIEGCGEKVDDSVFERLSERLSYVSGDFGDAETFDRVAHAIGDAERRIPVRVRDPADRDDLRRAPELVIQPLECTALVARGERSGTAEAA